MVQLVHEYFVFWRIQENAQVLPIPRKDVLWNQTLGDNIWLRCESVHSEKNQLTVMVSQAELRAIHSMIAAFQTEKGNQLVQRLPVLLQTENCANGYSPSAAGDNTNWNKLPTIFAESVRSVTEKIIKKARQQVHVVRHPEDVPVTRVSVHWSKMNTKLCIGLLQSIFAVDHMVHEFIHVACGLSGLRKN
jgi:hypothetical protein